MKWTEIIAAGTVILIAWSFIASASPPTAPYDYGPNQYRDYSNLVIRDGRVVGGL